MVEKKHPFFFIFANELHNCYKQLKIAILFILKNYSMLLQAILTAFIYQVYHGF